MSREESCHENVSSTINDHWVVPEKIHTPPPTEEFFAVRRGREEKCRRMSKGGERKNVLGCPTGGGEECGYVCLKV